MYCFIALLKVELFMNPEHAEQCMVVTSIYNMVFGLGFGGGGLGFRL